MGEAGIDAEGVLLVMPDSTCPAGFGGSANPLLPLALFRSIHTRGRWGPMSQDPSSEHHPSGQGGLALH